MKKKDFSIFCVQPGILEVKGDFKLTDNLSDVITTISSTYGKGKYTIRVSDKTGSPLFIKTIEI